MGLLNELKHDLVDPVKAFTKEVGEDTLGDAGRFYAAKARRIRDNARIARERTREKSILLRLEMEEKRKRRKAMVKRALILLAALAVLILVFISVALSRGTMG